MTQEQLDNVVTAINNRAKTTDVSSGLATKVDKVTSTDNAIARFDGTTGALQNSGVTISDANVVTASGFVGPFTGNASTATKLANARTIGITGDITWTSPSFDGSGNITAAATLADSGVTAGTYSKVTVDSKGRTISGTALSAIDIPALDVSKITTGTLSVARGGTGVTTSTGTGSVVFSTSPVLTTPNIGVATGTSFNSITGLSSTTPANNGTAAVGTSTTVARADHVHASDSTKVTANANITAGTATKITYDAKGLVTAGTQMSLEDIPDSTFKKSVRCATTANLAATYANNVLTLSSVGVTVIDGITIALNDRVLIKDQTTTLQNGIYTVTTLGTASVATVFTRSLDADVITELASSLVAVDSGTVNGGRLFDNDLKTTDTLGTTAVAFNLVVDTGFASTVVGSTPGTAAIGTSTSYARADHVHPVQTSVTGNARTATTLQTARTISGVSFNGSENIDIEDRLGTAIASDATTTVGTRGLGDYIHITGTTTITSLGTATAAGIRRTLIFDGALRLTHNATSLICPGAANIVTVAGTIIEVVAETTANWRVVSVTHPSLSMAELGYLDGVTSSIQTQLNGKAPLASPALTGTPTAPTAAVGTNTTQLATTAFVVGAVTSAVVPVSTVIAIANAVVPTGFLECNGATISRTTYASLFSKIGTTYGVGDGSTTFAIPDLRGEFIRGWDNGRGVDSSRTIGSIQQQSFQSHNHAAGVSTSGGHAHPFSKAEGYASGMDGWVGQGNPAYGTTTLWTGGAGEHTHTVDVYSNGSQETRPRNIALMYCIKY